jgi:hypothetical protein
MVAKPVLSAEELAAALREALATPDDVTVLLGGRRIDSRERALIWLNDLGAERAAVIRRNSAGVREASLTPDPDRREAR